MKEVIESGMVLRFPSDDFIRLDKTKEFNLINTHNLKAVDFVYYHRESHTVLFIELKNYDTDSHPANFRSKDLIVNLQKKSADSLLMMLSLFHGYNYMKDLYSRINPLQDRNPRFDIIHILKVSKSQVLEINSVHSEFQNQFKGIARLFSIDHFLIIPETMANHVLNRYGIEYLN